VQESRIMTLAMHQVLVVSGDDGMRGALRALLISQGFRCIEAGTAEEGDALARQRKTDFALLDLDLPNGATLALIQRVRRWSPVPIIVLSRQVADQGKIAALEGGADDFVAKPFNATELLARMRAILRRSARGTESSEVLTLGEVRLDLGRRQASNRRGEIHLTPLEYRVLECLVRHQGFVVPRARLVEEVWGPEHGGDTQSLRVCIKNLRRKLERYPRRPHIITTETGVGYRLRARPRLRC
jgi:two-component system, OmpR family, KDP operon response regulator KdpE